MGEKNPCQPLWSSCTRHLLTQQLMTKQRFRPRLELTFLTHAAAAPLLLASLFLLLVLLGPVPRANAQDAIHDIEFFSNLKDRSTGTEGAEAAADYILKAFSEVGLADVASQEFLVPVPAVAAASLEVGEEHLDLYPWGPNLVYLPMTPSEGLSGPLLYAEDGDFEHFDNRNVKGAIVLMEMSSWENWTNAAMLGASALIFLGDRNSIRGEFTQKNIPTPVAFPRFWVTPETGAKLKELAQGKALEGTVKSKTRWQNKLVRNCYGFLPGKHPQLKSEIVVLEAFYDASSVVLGLAPGADEATSIATLLAVARNLARDPPDRSVLFLATAGNGQSLCRNEAVHLVGNGPKEAAAEGIQTTAGAKAAHWPSARAAAAGRSSCRGQTPRTRSWCCRFWSKKPKTRPMSSSGRPNISRRC